MNEIFLAGGCFWGVQYYLSLIDGVLKTDVGYANGIGDIVSYYDVCKNKTGHAEAVRVQYDPNIVSLDEILKLYYKIIDPTVLNRQGPDIGIQYRTGIYYTDIEDKDVILRSLNELQSEYKDSIVVEVCELKNYCVAEIEHQDYLYKNPKGYCHIDSSLFIYSKQFKPKNKL